jgi:hypothetical protein
MPLPTTPLGLTRTPKANAPTVACPSTLEIVRHVTV